ncbi:MAG: Gfo/Idh/MocA family protein [Myxococcota bacterium]
MRIILLGLGTQGKKRRAVAGADVVATVDPVCDDADYRRLKDVDLDAFDAALVCVPDSEKLPLVRYLLENGKHTLVEKPLLAESDELLTDLRSISRKSGAVCYTAYNHRFEPHFIRMRDVLRSGRLGRIYLVRLFYGNGTARDVRESVWRDRGGGVIPDLGSHLLDTILFWFGTWRRDFELDVAYRFENRAFDHVVIRATEEPAVELEASLVCWRNSFSAEIFAEHGSAHIESLCKWGPTTFTVRERRLPSGRPREESITLVQPDPTWEQEYLHFRQLCSKAKPGTFAEDLWINRTLVGLIHEALERSPT